MVYIPPEQNGLHSSWTELYWSTGVVKKSTEMKTPVIGITLDTGNGLLIKSSVQFGSVQYMVSMRLEMTTHLSDVSPMLPLNVRRSMFNWLIDCTVFMDGGHTFARQWNLTLTGLWWLSLQWTYKYNKGKYV